MTCILCGGQMVTHKEDVPYTAGGLPHVTLLGVEVSRCLGCDNVSIAIPRLEALHKTIATVLAKKPGRLLGSEIRFLRKYLGWSGVDFAAHIGVSPETVSRWEHDHEPIGSGSDRALRLMAMHGVPAQEYPLDALTTITNDASPYHVGIRALQDHWEPVAA